MNEAQQRDVRQGAFAQKCWPVMDEDGYITCACGTYGRWATAYGYARHVVDLPELPSNLFLWDRF